MARRATTRSQPDWEAVVRHNEEIMRQSMPERWDRDFENVQSQLQRLKDPTAPKVDEPSPSPSSPPRPNVSEALRTALTDERPPTRDLNVLRVSQIDASLLDGEVQNILKSRMLKAFSFFRPGWVHSIKPELELALQLMVWWLSIWKEGATYGQRLQNLTYRNESAARSDLVATSLPLPHLFPISRTQRLLFALITIVGQWAFSRLEKYVLAHDWAHADEDWKHKAAVTIRTMATLIKAMNFSNFVIFMFTGRYTSLVERLLHMRLVYAQQNIPRFHSFEFLNRELVWQGFTEFLTFLMPLINFDRIRRFINQKILRKGPKSLPESTCAFCSASPMSLPHRADCGHSFCYYCVKVALMQQPGLECPRCSSPISSLVRNDPIAV